MINGRADLKAIEGQANLMDSTPDIYKLMKSKYPPDGKS